MLDEKPRVPGEVTHVASFTREGTSLEMFEPEWEVKMHKDGEVATIRVDSGGQVAVVREEGTTLFRPQYSFVGVISEFEERGWNIHEGTQEGTHIPEDIQQATDEYLKLHEEAGELRKKMEKLKTTVRKFMDDKGVDSIPGTDGKEVYLQDAKASNSTSRYTDYELQEVATRLEGGLLRKVTEIRVNSEKLEGLMKTGDIDKPLAEEIKELKISKKGTPRFSVRK